jgi:hypothetical protein
MAQDLVTVHDAVEVARSERLIDCVKTGEGRAERMYAAAEAIVVKALGSGDLRTAIQAIRTSLEVMAEARAYLELRGDLTRELGKDRTPPPRIDSCIVITRDVDPVPVKRPTLLPPPPPPVPPTRAAD